MAYIAPNSTIKILYSVPLSRDYEHTVRFNANDVVGQYNAFNSYARYTFTAQSYQRYDRGTLRIQINPDNLYNCNYLMFQNSSFGDKWFYAFIDSVEYINNITAEVRYTIDVMQTYYFDYNLQDCYVEREHSATDNVGDNLVPENIGLGDEICHYESKHFYTTTNMRTIIVYMPNYDENLTSLNYVEIDSNNEPVVSSSVPTEQYSPSIRNRFGGGICCLALPVMANEQKAILTTKAIAKIKGVGGSIITTFDLPTEVYNDNFMSVFNTHDFSVNERGSFVYAKNPNTSYSPKNMKLLQYPFRKLIISNGNGGTAEYNWELFTNRHTVSIGGISRSIPQATFEYFSAMLPDPMVRCYPTEYRGYFMDGADYENGCTLSDFPRQCYSEDSYAAWKGQNSNAIAISTISGMLSGTVRAMGSGSKYGKASGIASTIEQLGDNVAMDSKARHTPDAVIMQTNTPIVNIVKNRFGFVCYDVGITGEMAKTIDDYFSVFGYATHEVKTPNFVGNSRRPIWNYVKLGTVVMNGDHLPADAQAEIEKIYKKGITFWETMALVGDYNANNAPST